MISEGVFSVQRKARRVIPTHAIYLKVEGSTENPCTCRAVILIGKEGRSSRAQESEFRFKHRLDKLDKARRGWM